MVQHVNMPFREFLDVFQDNCLNATELKNIIFHAMPKFWQNNVINSRRDIIAESLEDIEKYMMNQKSIMALKQNKNNPQGGDKHKHDNHNNTNNNNKQNNFHTNNYHGQ